MAKITVIERVDSDSRTIVLAARQLKDAYELALLHGRIADPSLSYKTVQRRLQFSDTVFFYDKVKYETEAEAIYSPAGAYMILTRTELK